MDRDEILKYLTEQIDVLQRKAAELQEQHDEIEKQLKAYKELFRAYRTVYESEAGVGPLNKLPSDVLKILEEKLNTSETLGKKAKSDEAKGCNSRKSVAWAVHQILLVADSSLSTREVYGLVKDKYSSIAEKARNPFHDVESALSRGYQRGLYHRTNGRYRLTNNV